MSITFDHVEGVVQRDADGTPAADPAAPPAPQARPVREQLEEAHRRMEWAQRRIHAD